MEPTIEAGKDAEGGVRQPLGPVVQIDEGRIQAHLDEVVRSTVEETSERVAGCGGRRALRCAEVRTHRGPQGHAGGQLRSASADQGRRCDSNSAEAAQPAVRDGDH